MFLLGVLLWKGVLSDGAKLQTATPTDAWLGQCENIMKKENSFENFSMAVSHGIHSITLQDIRAFFDEEAEKENGIPTVNRDMRAKDDKIIVPNAPDIGGDFQSIAMQTFDVALTHMDDPNYIQTNGILERLSHHFHMHELWTKAQTYFKEFADSDLNSTICECALNTTGNGIDQELTNIFIYFRDFFNKPKSLKKNRKMAVQSESMSAGCSFTYKYGYGYSYHLQMYCGRGKRDVSERKPLPKLTSSTAWVEWKKMLNESMLDDKDVRKFALFMYCALY